MNNILFLIILFSPFIFSLFLILKRLNLSYVKKPILDYGLIFCAVGAFLVSAINQILKPDITNIFLIIANTIFIFLCVFSFLFFKHKKQFMFTRLRFNVFLSLLMSVTYLFILSQNLVSSLVFWIISGILVYIFSYFDIFKTNSDYNSNRFYSIFLTGDFCLLLAVFIFVKYAIILDNYSYFINFSDLKLVASYIIGNSDFEYIILPILVTIALFSRACVFPFSCLYSFLANASSLLYLVIFSVFAPLYSLILFLKLDLFDDTYFYCKIYLLLAVLFILLLLPFEKHFKIIFGYLLSIANTIFIFLYFYNETLSYVVLLLSYVLLFTVISILFLKDKLSFKRRLININNGFIQERFFIALYEKAPVKIAYLTEFLDKKIIRKIFYFFLYLIDVLSYNYMRFIQKKEIPSIIKGIMMIFALFALLSIFIGLFGNFGEMQS
ncbi:MAG: hypothetical protein IJ877_02340 [Candidatus Gastranaerophilales bacterium]|nr:hypothetical protein [Candidatus Gastranaerophilales bacterium]